jgi:hypothetical protein
MFLPRDEQQETDKNSIFVTVAFIYALLVAVLAYGGRDHIITVVIAMEQEP